MAWDCIEFASASRISSHCRLFSCTENSVGDLIESFRQGMSIVTKPTFSPLLDWSVNRIDYTMDISIPNVAEYVSLAKRAKLPRQFVQRVNEEGSLYVECDSVTLNFYDKNRPDAEEAKLGTQLWAAI